MKLLEIGRDSRGGLERLVARVVRDGWDGPAEAYLGYLPPAAAMLHESPDPFVPPLLVACLETGEPLELAPPVSPRLLRGLERAQDVLLSFFPTLRRVEVRARPRHEPVARAHCAGAFFSCGADSWYTLLRAERGDADPGPLTHLVFMRGLEQYAQFKLWGSHPLLDDAWSTETVDVLHDGAEASRADKLEALARWTPRPWTGCGCVGRTVADRATAAAATNASERCSPSSCSGGSPARRPFRTPSQPTTHAPWRTTQPTSKT